MVLGKLEQSPGEGCEIRLGLGLGLGSDQYCLALALGDEDLYFELFFEGRYDFSAQLNAKIEEKFSTLDPNTYGTRNFGEEQDLKRTLTEYFEKIENDKHKALRGGLELAVNLTFNTIYRSTSETLLLKTMSYLGNRFKTHENYGVFHVGLEFQGITIDWGATDYTDLVLPRVNMDQIIAKFALSAPKHENERHQLLGAAAVVLGFGVLLFIPLVGGLFSAITAATAAAIVAYYVIKENYYMKVMIANKGTLQGISEVCTRYNTSEIGYSILNKNCNTFVKDCLDRNNHSKIVIGDQMEKFLGRCGNNDKKFQLDEKIFNSIDEIDEFAEESFEKLDNDRKHLICCYEALAADRKDDANLWKRYDLTRNELEEKWSIRRRGLHK